MKKTDFKNILSVVLSIVLIAAVALTMSGCSDKKPIDSPEDVTLLSPNNAEATEPDGTITLGEGEVSFLFNVTDHQGNVTKFKISTDEKTVGDALIKEGLISGDEGDYGLYVKKVNGIELDYDTHGKYWAFYVNGEYGMTGVDMTEIENGALYEFKAEQ